MIGFNSNEVQKIFEGLEPNQAVVEEIRKTFLGNPSDIIELRKILKKDDVDSEGMVTLIPENIFDYLWSKQNFDEDIFLSILAVIIFSSKELSLLEICEILSIDEKKVIEEIERSSFITLENSIPHISNETYHKRLEDKLDSKRKETYDILANFILKSENKTDYWLLTKYYEEAERYSELIKLLDDSDYINSVISANSMSSLRFLVQSGLKGSSKIDSLANYYKFSLESSLIMAQANSDNSSEIEALMLLNQEEKAISIANNSRVIEERIHLLSIVGRIQKIARGVVEEQLLINIRNIYENLNLEYIGEKGVAIASELITFDVDLAIKLLEKTFDLESDSNAIDKMMVALSIDSFTESASDKTSNLFENVRDRMKDPEMKNIFSTMFNFSKAISPKNLVIELEKIDLLNVKVTFLANWCNENDGEDKKTEILEYAFDILSTSDDYKSNASIYFKLSNQLLYDNVGDYERIIELFDSRQSILEENGPTVFYVRMELNLISCLDKNNKHIAVKRVEKLYEYIENIEDISIKLECKSYLLSALCKYGNFEFYEKDLSIFEIIKEELDTELSEVTSNFAYQEELLAKALQVLAYTDLAYCLEIAKRVNTAINREKLYVSIIDGLISQGIQDVDIAEIQEKDLFHIIDVANLAEYDLDIYDESIYRMMDSLKTAVQEKKKKLLITVSGYYKILGVLKNIRDSRKRSLSYGIFYILFQEEEFFSEKEEEKIFQLIIKCWNGIDILPNKTSIGYEIVTLLAKEKPGLATKLLNIIQEEKMERSQFSSEEFWGFIMSLRILIHSFKEITYENNSNVANSIERIKSLIDKVESNGEQAILYSLLLLAVSNKINQLDSKEILSLISKKIDCVSAGDTRFRTYVLNKCSPAIYAHSNSYFESNLEVSSPKEKDRIFVDLCTFYLTKTNTYQPFNFDSTAKFDCTYEDVLETLNLLVKIENDSYKYGLIKMILEMIKSDKGPKLNNERKNDLKIKITSVIEKSFNSNKFIQHEGYKILSEYHHWCCFDSFQKEKVQSFIARIKLIPNMSDRVFCMTMIASEIKPKYHDYRNEILAEAEESIDQLNSTAEKILRLEDMASSIKSKKNVKEKHYIEKALSMIDGYGNPKVEKRLIDLAYQIDSEFAGSMVSSIKEDSIQLENSKKRAEKRINYLKLNNKIKNDKGKEDFSQIQYDEALKIGDACWEAYAGLLSKNLSAKKPNQLKEYLRIGARLPIEKSFPIFSWFLENSNNKSDKVGLSDIFEASFVACKFALANKHYSEQRLEDIEEYYDLESDSIIVTADNSDEATKFIAKKISTGTVSKIILVDPYFDLEDLNFIFTLYQLIDTEEVYFYILTGPNRTKSSYTDEKNEEEFRDFWKNQVSSENPPNISIIVVTNKLTGDCPFHDRYIIANESGVQLGGSINGLGKTKELSVSLLSEDIRQKRDVYYTHYINNDMFYFKKNNIEATIVGSFYL